MESHQEKYDDLGGVYFPVLQQDGSRTLLKIGKGKSNATSELLFLAYLRQHDRAQVQDSATDNLL